MSLDDTDVTIVITNNAPDMAIAAQLHRTSLTAAGAVKMSTRRPQTLVSAGGVPVHPADDGAQAPER